MNRYDHKNCDHYRQSCLNGKPRPYRIGRSIISQFHSLSTRSCLCNGERSKMSLSSGKGNSSTSGSGYASQGGTAMMKPQVLEKALIHRSPGSPKPVLHDFIQQESVQQGILTQELSSGHSESVMFDTPTRSALPSLPPSSVAEKTHEVGKLSEALDKLRQQQCTLTRYIRQLKYIRRQKGEERRLLRKRRSTLLREMNLSDSQAETSSSDDFIDDTADGLGTVETGVESYNAEEFIGSVGSNVASSAAVVIGETCDQSGSSTTEMFLVKDTSNAPVKAVLSSSRLPGVYCFL